MDRRVILPLHCYKLLAGLKIVGQYLVKQMHLQKKDTAFCWERALLEEQGRKTHFLYEMLHQAYLLVGMRRSSPNTRFLCERPPIADFPGGIKLWLMHYSQVFVKILLLIPVQTGYLITNFPSSRLTEPEK
ncbi:MAG TPA: hypothetical protein VK203_25600 [Nostocaceae cyanobacterium]|nr:hypothetical protein [Nostocaceae cyanobacterium]